MDKSGSKKYERNFNHKYLNNKIQPFAHCLTFKNTFISHKKYLCPPAGCKLQALPLWGVTAPTAMNCF